MAQVHHDLAAVLEVVHLLLDLRERRIRQVKRQPDHRFPRRATPLICQVNCRPKLHQLFVFQLTVELLNEVLHRRPLNLQPQLPHWLAEDVPQLRSQFFEMLHQISELSTQRGEVRAIPELKLSNFDNGFEGNLRSTTKEWLAADLQTVRA